MMVMKAPLFRTLYVVGLVMVLQLGRAAAQDNVQPGAQATAPVFRSHSELVLVPVVVKDHHGNHVSGLTKEAFVVKENGVQQKLAICDEVKTTAELVQRGTEHGPKSSFSNFQEDQPARRIVILALDAINTPFAAQADARKQLIKYLSDAVDPGALVSLVMIRRGDVKVIHDFTTNPAVLIAALRKARGVRADVETIEQLPAEDDPLVQTEADELTAFAEGEIDAVAEQKRMAIVSTLSAMQQIAQRYAGVPGRKALIWVTAGFPFSIDSSDAQMTGRTAVTGLDDLLPDYEHMWTLFNAANVAVYPVDVRGLENPTSMDASIGRTSVRGNASRRMAQHQDSLDTFRSFAEMTGGKAFYDTNDLAKSFREAAEDSASYYMLGYYLERNAKPGWHKLKVNVQHPGSSARARDGFFVEKGNEAKSRESELARALASPMDYTAVPVTLRWDARVRLNNSPLTTIKFEVEMPADAVEVDGSDNNHVSFDVIAVAKLPDGSAGDRTAKQVDAHLKPETATRAHEKGMIYNQSLQLANGSYTIRVVVRDNLSGRIGSVSAPIQVE